MPGIDLLFFDQVGDAPGEDASFAGAGACQDQNRARGRLDCGLLLVVETFKDLGHLPFLQLEALPVQKAHIAVVAFV